MLTKLKPFIQIHNPYPSKLFKKILFDEVEKQASVKFQIYPGLDCIASSIKSQIPWGSIGTPIKIKIYNQFYFIPSTLAY